MPRPAAARRDPPPEPAPVPRPEPSGRVLEADPPVAVSGRDLAGAMRLWDDAVTERMKGLLGARAITR